MLLQEDWFERLKLAHDASHYLLVPEAVGAPAAISQVAAAFKKAHESGRTVTLRSGGTSLSGQALSDSVLVDVRQNFSKVKVIDDGKRVRVGPGTTVRRVNSHLLRHRRKLGPDPASEIACTIGGVIANNSSGMTCGTEFNSYNTIESMTVVLPSGTIIDTADPDADQKLEDKEPDLYAGLSALRRRILNNPRSVSRIESLFAIKNTMGYSLNAFIDYENPVDILLHLMVGSEGTLGFVAEAVFRTIPVQPHIATALLIFPDLEKATNSLPALIRHSPSTIELMDAAALRVAQTLNNAPAELKQIAVDTEVALLVETEAVSQQELDEKTSVLEELFDVLPLTQTMHMSSDPVIRSALWEVRKGLYPAVAEARVPGSVALLEDVVVPVARLKDACQGLIELFDKHDYEQSVIFGHAKDGNVHFMLSEDLTDPANIARYEQFTEDMVSLILEMGGSLKAEHGTGRIMAPFVERQYGGELYDVMWKIKSLFDPHGILNPDVILTKNPKLHLDNFKHNPPVEVEVDRCVECGYCEPVCPSRQLSTTPRQRIIMRREIEKARQSGNHMLVEELEAAYAYQGDETCAVDGMCEIACPVNINTGDLTRRLRSEQRSVLIDSAWNVAAKSWNVVTSAAATGLNIAEAVPTSVPSAITSVARKTFGNDLVPLYDPVLPRGGTRRLPIESDTTDVAVLLPSCLGAMFAPETSERSLGATRSLLALCNRAGITVRTPEGVNGLCCGTPWSSKGMKTGLKTIAFKTLTTLWEASEEGDLPIVCDAASCTEGLKNLQKFAGTDSKFEKLKFVDAVEFVFDDVMPRLHVTRRYKRIALHPTCSSERLAISHTFLELASLVADDAVVPTEWQCCGFAGDRGLLHPELTASATREESVEITSGAFDAYVSVNRTCELALTKATGHNYQHIVELVEQATRPRSVRSP